MNKPEGQGTSFDPIDMREVIVPSDVWARWEHAARTSLPRGWWGGSAALVCCAASMMLGFLILDPSSHSAVTVISPVAAAIGWWVGRWLGERSFRVVAREMRAAVCPSLVRTASSDDLMRLARHGAVLFTSERVHARSISRDGRTVLIAHEYDLSTIPYIWPSAGGIA